MDLGSIYNWFTPKIKLCEMEDKTALQVIYKLVLDRARRVFKSKYFRKATKYHDQDGFNQLVYYHEIVTSLLAETKLLLLDYQKIQQESQIYNYVADNIGECLINSIKSTGAKDKEIPFWSGYLERKEENISARITEMRELAIKNGSNFCRALVNMPENLIVRSSASDAYDFFTAKDRGDKKDEKLLNYILDEHTKMFKDIKNIIIDGTGSG